MCRPVAVIEDVKSLVCPFSVVLDHARHPLTVPRSLMVVVAVVVDNLTVAWSVVSPAALLVSEAEHKRGRGSLVPVPAISVVAGVLARCTPLMAPMVDLQLAVETKVLGNAACSVGGQLALGMKDSVGSLAGEMGTHMSAAVQMDAD